MSSFNTVKAITTNLKKVVAAIGVKVRVVSSSELDNTPLSILPMAIVDYEGESFENNFGEMPKYVEATYIVKVVTKKSTGKSINNEEDQKWIHKVRDALNVNTLNINELATSKLISMVKINSINVEEVKEKKIISFKLTIRYRE